MNWCSTALRALRWVTPLALIGLPGCASLHNGVGPGQKLDPWEGWNRKVFSFNESLDENLLKPVATFYSKAMPQRARQGIDNFFSNPFDAWSAVNSFLQGKVGAGCQDMMRFGTNTLFGLGGLIDIASELGLSRQREDFGQTLAYWGVGAGAYVVWPFFGSSTVRESFAMPLDWSVSPALLLDDGTSRTVVTVVQAINLRAGLLGASRVLDEIALDKYTFVRDAYLQRRHSLIFDGDEPAPAAPPSPDLFPDDN